MRGDRLMMWYDMLMLAFLIFATIRGAIKGFVWQLAAIAAIVLCFGFAGSMSQSLAPMITGVEPPLDRWIAMFGLYLFFSFISFAVARQLRSWIEKARFVEYDRHLGSLFGLIKGATFGLVVTFFVVTLSESARKQVFDSYSGHAAALIMDRLHPVMPEELHGVLEPYIHQLDRPGANLLYSDGEESRNAPKDDQPGPRAGAQNGAMTTPSTTGGFGARRDALIQEIVKVFSNFSGSQAAITEEIESSLSGLPDEVTLAVLEDWRADMFSQSPDPDPVTSQAASIDFRILRQLEKSGISLSTLSSNLQERLNEWLPR